MEPQASARGGHRARLCFAHGHLVTTSPEGHLGFSELEFVEITIIVVVVMVMVVVITCLLSHYKLSARSFIGRHSQGRRREDALSSEGCLWPSDSTVSGSGIPEPQVYAPPRPTDRLAVPPFAQRDRFHRFQPTYPYLQHEIDLPPTISLSDGEEPPPYQGPCTLQLRDPEQQLELNRESVRAPPNRTIFDSDLMDSAVLGGPYLEQRILQVLKGAGTPVKAAQLEKECQVPRKDINRALYRMRDKLQVDRDDSAKWRLREGGPGEMVPTEPARPSHELQEQILRLLETRGPQRALSIAKSLGMKTSKDVNRYLYAMQEEHLLDLDKNSKTWKIYQPGTPRAPPIIYQQSPVMICQNAPHSHISIQNSEAVQIGHGNTIVRLTAPAESGSMAPGYLPLPPAAGPLGQDPPAGSWGPQDVRIDSTVLKYVQLGQGNKMKVHTTPATGAGHSPPAPGSRAAEPRGKFPDGAGRADPDMSTFTSHLEAMTLHDRDPEAPEDSP
ncbi:Transmembrane prostate androgen-induced protein [Myotis davidii]|uniref:Transmembrane prostate androgen-induced protein n=1 Tax=Myotis davidii TaxID=225400 RepID=L5M6P1_MYODS|nr:Transmembrane prostate androgen-induced protein [Myotis davidii]